MPDKSIIKGEFFSDHRGGLRFFNQLNLQEIVRFYEISPADTEQIRGWQAHQKEKKWFYCLQGSFIINTIKIDNFEKPSNQLLPSKYMLDDSNPVVLYVTEGHATALKATSEKSRLQVFSNFALEQSKNDDFRFPFDKWSADWKI